MNYTLGKKAIKRMSRGKLGVYPLVDIQGVTSIYFLHKKARKIQIFADKVLGCPRYFIHKKKGYYYIKVTDYYIDRWLAFVKENSKWRRSW